MIKVTCAVIRNDDSEVLIVQRGKHTDHPFKWEFPGGKIDEGETDEECIVREILEELSMDIVISGRLPDVDYNYGFKEIRLMPFICDTLDDLPILSEHVAHKWIPPSDLVSIDFSEADILVAGEYLKIAEVKINVAADLVEEKTIDESQTGKISLSSIITTMMSTKEANWIAASAIENTDVFNELLELAYSDDKKLSFHSSWTLSKVYDMHPEAIAGHLPGIIQTLGKIKNESTRRSFLRILSLTDIDLIDSRYHGILADECFSFLRSGFSAIAIKAYSMEILYKLVLRYPELKNELIATISMLQSDNSAGIRSKGRIILNKLGTSFPD
jgi:8-oxo-dGTP diphosphatase